MIAANSALPLDEKWRYFVVTQQDGRRLYCTAQVYYVLIGWDRKEDGWTVAWGWIVISLESLNLKRRSSIYLAVLLYSRISLTLKYMSIFLKYIENWGNLNPIFRILFIPSHYLRIWTLKQREGSMSGWIMKQLSRVDSLKPRLWCNTIYKNLTSINLERLFSSRKVIIGLYYTYINFIGHPSFNSAISSTFQFQTKS